MQIARSNSVLICVSNYIYNWSCRSSRYREISPSSKCAENGHFDSAPIMLCAVSSGGGGGGVVQPVAAVCWTQSQTGREWCWRVWRIELCNQPSRSFHNHGEGPYSTRASSLLKAHTSAFTIKTLWGHYTMLNGHLNMVSRCKIGMLTQRSLSTAGFKNSCY